MSGYDIPEANPGNDTHVACQGDGTPEATEALTLLRSGYDTPEDNLSYDTPEVRGDNISEASEAKTLPRLGEATTLPRSDATTLLRPGQASHCWAG